MALTKFTTLDFEEIKSNIKEYIRANSNFTDYEFEGSTLSFLIDILAYNTYISSYNANMMSNEVFIDSATLRENVVAFTRNVGYLPRSKRSSVATISFTVRTNLFPKSITIRKGIVCVNSSNSTNKSYTFSIPSDVTSLVSNNEAVFNNLQIYEGNLVEEEFTVDTFNKNQRFILSNSNIDYTTLRVKVKDSVSSNVSVNYNLADSIFDINENSNVFFIQEIEDERYEIIFGDGIFGKKLSNGNVIEVSYIVTNGVDGNDANQFTFSGNLVDNDDNRNLSNSTTITRIRTISSSKGGQDIESISSIKTFAGRIYASQNRAVTSRDYETIVRKIYPETESITAFGGEELDPPKFGRVYIAVKPTNGLFLSNNIKDNIKRELRKYSIAGIVPTILDTKYLFIETNSVVYYNPSLAKDASSVRNKVLNNLTKFSKSDEINQYGSRFKYSKFLSIIDNSDVSITSNITEVRIRRDMRVVLNRLAEYEICFGNRFKILNETGFNIKTTAFRVSGISDNVYFSDIPNEDQTTGEIVLIKFINPLQGSLNSVDDVTIVRRNVGSIDYKSGDIRISALNILSTAVTKNSLIQISACPSSNDVIGLQDLYLQYDTNRSSISLISDDITSGSDTSGIRYIQTPSYSDTSVIRY